MKGKLVKLTKDINGRFDNYSSSPKTRQILLYWGYELVENDLFYNQNIIFSNNFVHIKMSYYLFNRPEIL